MTISMGTQDIDWTKIVPVLHHETEAEAVSENHALARQLAEHGIPVFPCHAGGARAKAPLVARGFHDASCSCDDIDGWWTQWPESMPGIPTGSASGLAVIDGDVAKNTGEALGEREVAQLGFDVEGAVRVTTASGGVHLIFRHVDGARNTTKQLADHVDTRGEGGYIIAPGSVMADGRRYSYAGRSLASALRADDLPEYPVEAVQAAIETRRAAKRAQQQQAPQAPQAQVQADAPAPSPAPAPAPAGAGAGVPVGTGQWGLTGVDWGSVTAPTQATDAENIEVACILLSEAPNTLPREDWVKLALSLRSAGEELRGDFVAFSQRYAESPCSAAEAERVWESARDSHTVTSIGPALSLLQDAVGPDRFRAVMRDVLRHRPRAGHWDVQAQAPQAQAPQTDAGAPATAPAPAPAPTGAGDPIAQRAAQLRGSMLSLADALPDLSRRYLVKSWLDSGALSVLYGPSNSGKTFVALDLALHVAAGADWRDCRVQGGPVVYVAAEGGGGIRARLAALRQARPELAERAELYVMPTSLDLYEGIDAQAFCASLPAVPALIVIDTLARSIGAGEENSARDMSQLIANLDRIRRATGAHVMVVHHSGKNADAGARGSSALRAAVDTELAVYEGTIRPLKQRDMAFSDPLGFKLESVALGIDEDGDEVNSAIVVPASLEQVAPAAGTGTRRKQKRLTGQAEVAMNALDEAMRRFGERNSTGTSDLPRDRDSVAIEHWQAACVAHGLVDTDASDAARRKAFSRAKQALIKADCIREYKGRVWRVNEGEGRDNILLSPQARAASYQQRTGLATGLYRPSPPTTL